MLDIRYADAAAVEASELRCSHSHPQHNTASTEQLMALLSISETGSILPAPSCSLTYRQVLPPTFTLFARFLIVVVSLYFFSFHLFLLVGG